jgi:hypothetical protein
MTNLAEIIIEQTTIPHGYTIRSLPTTDAPYTVLCPRPPGIGTIICRIRDDKFVIGHIAKKRITIDLADPKLTEKINQALRSLARTNGD